MKLLGVGALATLVFLCFSSLHFSPTNTAAAAINPEINFQGKLDNPDGTNVTDGDYSIVFSIYSTATGGTALWAETQTVAVSDGIFQVDLGSVTPLPGTINFDSSNLYLGIKVGSDAEMTPRIQFTSVPQAFDSSELGGLSSSAFGQLAASQTFTGTNTFQSSSNITAVKILQNSNASPTADVFDVQTANGSSNFIQVTSTAANQGAVTIQSIGSGNALNLTSGSGTINVGATNITATGGLTVAAGGTNQNIDVEASGTGSVALGTSANNKTVNIGAVGTTADTTALNLATSSGAAQTVAIGGINTGSSVKLTGGGSSVNVTNSGITLTASGLSSGVVLASSGLLSTASTLGVTYGGTGLGSYTVGDLLYASGTSVLAGLHDVASGDCLVSGGTGAAPAWGSCTGGSGYVELGPSSAQTDSSTNSSIFINKTGAFGDLLQLQNNGTNVLTVGNTGAVNLQNATNSTTAFEIQNAAGTSNLLVADTTDSKLGVGAAPSSTGSLLQVGGTLSVSTLGTTGTSVLCYNATDQISSCGSAAGSGSYIYNQSASAQTANFDIAATTGIAAQIKGDASSDILDLLTSGGATVAQFTAAGNVNLGASGLASTIQIGNTTGAVAQTINIGTNTAASSQSINLGGTGGSAGTSSANTAVTLQGGATMVKVQNSGAVLQTFTNSNTALQIQDASSADLLDIDSSTTSNLLTNGDFEGNGTTGWTAKGSASIARVTSQAWQGNGSLQVATTTNGTAPYDGAQYAYAFSPDTTYTLSLYAKAASSNNVPVLPTTASATLTTGTTPYAITTGNFCNNGRADLAVTNEGSTTASIYCNTGSGLPTSPTMTLTTGTYPTGITTGNFCNNGRADLAVANYGSTTASIYCNTGSTGASAFSATATESLTTGSGPFVITTGNFCNNGRADLAVTNVGSTTASIYCNTGSTGASAFSATATESLTTGADPFAITTGNFCNNGRADLAVTNSGTTTTYIYCNTGSTGASAFSATATESLTTGTTPQGITTGNFCNNGRADIAVSNDNSTTASIYCNTGSTGSAAFSATATESLTTGSAPYGITTGNFCNNNRADLAVTNEGSTGANGTSIYCNTGSTGASAFSATATESLTTGSDPFAITTGNFSGSGLASLAIANYGSGTVSVYYQTTTTFTDINIGHQETGTDIDCLTGQTMTTNWTRYSCTFTTGPSISGTPNIYIKKTSLNAETFYIDGVQLQLGSTATAFNPGGDIQLLGTIDSPVAIQNLNNSTNALQIQNAAGSNILNVDTTDLAVTVGNVTTTNPSFTAAASLTTGSAPYGITTGNFCNNNRADLAVTNSGTTTAYIYCNTGSGLPTSPTITLTTGSNPYGITTGNFCNNGRADLAIANDSSSTASVYCNTGSTGSAAFSASATESLTTGPSPNGITTGNFCNTGRADLAVTNSGTTTTSIYCNTGSTGASAFSATPTENLTVTTTGINPDGITTGNFCNNGRADLAIASDSSTTYIYCNTGSTGSAAFSASATESLTTGSPQGITTGNFCNNGRADIAVSNYNSSTASIYCNTGSTGSAAFSATATESLTTGSHPIGITTGNFCNNGRADLAVASEGANTASIYCNTGSTGASAFSATATESLTTGSHPYGITTGNFSGSGLASLAITNLGSSTISIFTNTTTTVSSANGGTTTPFAAAGSTITTGSAPYGITTGNLCNNNRADLAVTNDNAATAYIYCNTGNGLPTSPTVTLTTGTAPIAITTGNFCNNGRADLAIANEIPNTTYIYCNTGSGGASAFSATATESLTTGAGPYAITTGNFCNNGRADIAVVNSGSSTTSIYCNTGSTGSAAFSATATESLTTGPSPNGITTGNFCNNGRADLAVSNYNSSTASIYCNTGSGGASAFSATATESLTTGTNPIAVTTGNFCNNGRADLAVTNWNSATASIYCNTGSTGSAALPTTATESLTTGTNPYAVTTGNFCNNGRADLAVSNQNSSTASIYCNTGSTGAAAFPTTNTESLTTGSPGGITTGNFSGSGLASLAITNPDSNTVSIFINIANSGATALTVAANASGVGVNILVGSSNSANALQVVGTSNTLLDSISANGGVNIGNLSTVNPGIPTTPNSTLATGSGPFWAATGNFCNNGRADLAVTNENAAVGDGVYIYCNTGSGLPTSPTIALTTSTNPWGITTGNFCNNGRADLAVTNSGTTTTYIYCNTGSTGASAFSATATESLTTGTTPQGITTGNFCNNGRADLAVTNSGTTTTSIYCNTGSTGSAAFSATATESLTTGSAPYGITTGNFCNNNRADLAVTNEGSTGANGTSIYCNTGSGLPTSPTITLTTGTTPQGITTGNFCNNGRADLAVANYGSTTASIYCNTGSTGSAAFSATATESLTTGSAPHGITTGNLCNNGRADLAVTNEGSTTTSIYCNTGTPGTGGGLPLTDTESLTTGSQPKGITTGNFSGNGLTGLAVANNISNTVSIYINGSSAGGIVIATTSATSQGEVIQGSSGQTADLLELQNSSGTVLDTITANGYIGIGISSPQTLLDIDSNPTSGYGADQIHMNDNSSAGGAYLMGFQGASGTDSVSDWSTGVMYNGSNWIQEDTGTGSLLTMSAASLDFYGTSGTVGGVATTSEYATINTGGAAFYLPNEGSYAVCYYGGAIGGNDVTQLTACSNDGQSDYAEEYPVTSGATYGDIVATGASMVSTYGKDSEGDVDWNDDIGQITQEVESTQAYQTNVVGVVSDNYGNFTSAGYNIKSSDNPMPVALNGRVPVNIAPDSPAIEPGDYITTSGTYAGEGMKATQAGEVVGMALGSWTPGSGQAQVEVFMNPEYWPGPDQASYLQNGQSAMFSDLNVSGNTTLSNLTVTGDEDVQGSLTVTGDSVFKGDITVGGHIVTSGSAPTLTIGTAAGANAAGTISGDDTAGTITVTTGPSSSDGSTPGLSAGNLVTATFNKAYSAAPHITLTPASASAAGLTTYIDNATTTGSSFNLDTTAPPAAGTTYIWYYHTIQ